MKSTPLSIYNKESDEMEISIKGSKRCVLALQRLLNRKFEGMPGALEPRLPECFEYVTCSTFVSASFVLHNVSIEKYELTGGDLVLASIQVTDDRYLRSITYLKPVGKQTFVQVAIHKPTKATTGDGAAKKVASLGTVNRKYWYADDGEETEDGLGEFEELEEWEGRYQASLTGIR